MKEAIVGAWETVMDSSRNPLRHLDLASQHYFMQVLGWMWSMVFSLTFLSIFEFGFTWLAHMLLREAESQRKASGQAVKNLSRGSRCLWKLDCEA